MSNSNYYSVSLHAILVAAAHGLITEQAYKCMNEMCQGFFKLSA